MSARPINPPFPYFTAPCARCGTETNSLSGAALDEPFTYKCSACQTDAERESVRLATNAATIEWKRREPGMVAYARRRLGIKRPNNVAYSADWEGCGVAP